MRQLMRWSGLALAMYVALALIMFATALAQGSQPIARFVVPGGTGHSTKILPGQTVMFEVRIDAPDKSTIGTAYNLTQSSPALAPGNFYFSVTGRDTVGSPFTDTTFGVTDAVATASPGNRLDPANDSNLGKNVPGLNGVPAGTNILATTITLSSEPTTPLGTYRIQPSAGSYITEVTTDPMGYDWAMAPPCPAANPDPGCGVFDIIVGAPLTVTRSGTGTGTVTANLGAINCGATCSDIYPGATVTLIAQPTQGSTFAGWAGGGCSGTGNCVVTISAATTVNAVFNLVQTATPTLIKTFNPTTIALGGTTTLTYIITNPPNNSAQTVGFTDTLPSGLRIAANPNTQLGCGNVNGTAIAGATAIVVTAATVPASTALASTCTMSVDVTNAIGQVNASCANNPSAFTNSANNISALSNLTNAVTPSCVVVQAPTPTLTKSFAPFNFTAGATTTLTFNIANPAGNPQQTVSFTDTLPSGLQIASPPATVMGSGCSGGFTTANGATFSVSGVTVAAGTATPANCVISVNVTNVPGQTNASCANNPAAFTNSFGNISATSNVANGVTPSCVTVTALASPSLDKAFNPITIVSGGATTLTFTVTNPAGSPAVNNVGFVDTLAAGLRVAGVANVGGTCANAAAATIATPASSGITVSGLQVAAGPSSCTVTVDVTNNLQQPIASCPAAAFTNSSSNVTVTNVTNAINSSCLTVTSTTPSLAKSFSPATFMSGGTTLLTLTITNPAGNNPPQNFSFTDSLPSGLQIAATPSLATTCTGGILSAPAGSGSVVVAGTMVGASTTAPSTCTISVNVTNQSGQNASCANNPPAFTNGATNIVGITNLNTTTTAPACVTVTGGLRIGNEASAMTLPGNSPLTFTMTATNLGPNDASGSVLTDAAIAGFTASALTCADATNGGACPSAASVTVANLQGPGIVLPTFPAGSAITFQLGGMFTLDTGSTTNIATVTAPPGVPLAATASATVGVIAPIPESIPTLSEWMLGLLAMMLGALAMRAHRRCS